LFIDVSVEGELCRDLEPLMLIRFSFRRSQNLDFGSEFL